MTIEGVNPTSFAFATVCEMEDCVMLVGGSSTWYTFGRRLADINVLFFDKKNPYKLRNSAQ